MHIFGVHIFMYILYVYIYIRMCIYILYTHANPRISILVLPSLSSNSFVKWSPRTSRLKTLRLRELGHKSRAGKLGLDLEVTSSSSPVDHEDAFRLGVELSPMISTSS